jgi:hypothetical protein
MSPLPEITMPLPSVAPGSLNCTSDPFGHANLTTIGAPGTLRTSIDFTKMFEMLAEAKHIPGIDSNPIIRSFFNFIFPPLDLLNKLLLLYFLFSIINQFKNWQVLVKLHLLKIPELKMNTHQDR